MPFLGARFRFHLGRLLKRIDGYAPSAIAVTARRRYAPGEPGWEARGCQSSNISAQAAFITIRLTLTSSSPQARARSTLRARYRLMRRVGLSARATWPRRPGR